MGWGSGIGRVGMGGKRTEKEGKLVVGRGHLRSKLESWHGWKVLGGYESDCSRDS